MDWHCFAQSCRLLVERRLVPTRFPSFELSVLAMVRPIVCLFARRAIVAPQQLGQFLSVPTSSVALLRPPVRSPACIRLSVSGCSRVRFRPLRVRFRPLLHRCSRAASVWVLSCWCGPLGLCSCQYNCTRTRRRCCSPVLRMYLQCEQTACTAASQSQCTQSQHAVRRASAMRSFFSLSIPTHTCARTRTCPARRRRVAIHRQRTTNHNGCHATRSTQCAQPTSGADCGAGCRCSVFHHAHSLVSARTQSFKNHTPPPKPKPQSRTVHIVHTRTRTRRRENEVYHLRIDGF